MKRIRKNVGIDRKILTVTSRLLTNYPFDPVPMRDRV
jgi:hypothetical protein